MTECSQTAPDWIIQYLILPPFLIVLWVLLALFLRGAWVLWNMKHDHN